MDSADREDPRVTTCRSTGRTIVQMEVGESIADVERRLILATLAQLHGDKRRAARQLGISLKTLYNRLSVYGAHELKRKAG